jgi:hypothetical protein
LGFRDTAFKKNDMRNASAQSARDEKESLRRFNVLPATSYAF